MTYQINFRVSPEEYAALKLLSKVTGKSIPSLIKDVLRDPIRNLYVETALKLYKERKLGLKAAWKLSQLKFDEFIYKLMENGIEPPIPESLDKEMIELADSLKWEDLFPPST